MASRALDLAHRLRESSKFFYQQWTWGLKWWTAPPEVQWIKPRCFGRDTAILHTDSQIFWGALLIIRIMFPRNVFPEFVFCWSKTAFTFPKIHKDEAVPVNRKMLNIDRDSDLEHLALSLVHVALFLLEYAELNALHTFMLQMNLFKNMMWNIKHDGHATHAKYTHIGLSVIKGWIFTYLLPQKYTYIIFHIISAWGMLTLFDIYILRKIVLKHDITLFICLFIYSINIYWACIMSKDTVFSIPR